MLPPNLNYNKKTHFLTYNFTDMKNNHTTIISYDILAVVIGLALVDDFNANEQNAIGNWLFLVGQVLQTNAAIQQTIEEKMKGVQININSKDAKKGKNPFTEYYIDKKEIDKLSKAIDTIQKKLESLK